MDKIVAYHTLLEEQFRRLNESREKEAEEYLLFTLGQPKTEHLCKEGFCYRFTDLCGFLSIDENLCLHLLAELQRDEMLIKFGSINGYEVYTTLHADVVFRILRGRAFEDDLNGRWVGHYRIDMHKVVLPDFEAKSIESLKDIIVNYMKENGVREENIKVIVEAIVDGFKKAGIKSIATWQYEAIHRILDSSKRFIVVHAPTATGKTLAFFIPVVIAAITAKLTQSTSNIFGSGSTLLVYPRKSLQIQQVNTFVKILYFVNESLKQCLGKAKFEQLFGLRGVSIAIDKGGEQEESEAEQEIGIICPFNPGLKVVQEVEGKDRDISDVKVFCIDGKGGKTFLPYFIGIVRPSRERELILKYNPDILVSNPWALRERIKSVRRVFRDAYGNRRFIVFDEAHVYIDTDYLELIAAIKHYRYVLENESKIKPKFVLSSATIIIDDKRKFALWLLDVPQHSNVSSIKLDEFVELDYEDLERGSARTALQIVITLLPYRKTIETTLQGVFQVLLTSLWQRNAQAIIFVDSISEASTVMSYIETILRGRKGVEICDHILNFRCREREDMIITSNAIRKSLTLDKDNYEDYSWSHMVNMNAILNRKVKEELNELASLFNIIALHHGGLKDSERRDLEDKFSKGLIKVLISTSTLELGMNYDDVTFVVQYKEPYSAESLIQRLGRAGRSDKAYKVALMFYLPPFTPTHVQLIHSRKSVFTLEEALLPHRSVIDAAFEVEVLERKLKETIYEYVSIDKIRRSLKRALRSLNNMLMELIHQRNTSIHIANIVRALNLLDEARRLRKELLQVMKALHENKEKVRSICKLQEKKVKKQGYQYWKWSMLCSYFENIFKDMKEVLDMLFINQKHAEGGIFNAQGLEKLLQDLNKHTEKVQQSLNSIMLLELAESGYVFSVPEVTIKVSPDEVTTVKELINLANLSVNNVKKFIDSINFKENVEELLFTLLFILAHPVIKPKWCKESRINVITSEASLERYWYECLRDEVLRKLRFLVGFHTESKYSTVSIKVLSNL